MSSLVSGSPFQQYVGELADFNARALALGGVLPAEAEVAHAHLDGRANRELRSAVPLHELRRIGAFFTGHVLARAVARRAGDAADWRAVVDPACGCGDLLLAAAARLPVEDDVESTLAGWGAVLHGVDRVPEFIHATRERLLLLALQRGARAERIPDLEALLPGIFIGDGMQASALAGADTVLLNPPYGQIQAGAGTEWASGIVTEAALWVEHMLATVPSGARVVSILPDVLRSGSRYAEWRRAIARLAAVRGLHLAGQFDALTDIDVFILTLSKRPRSSLRGRWPAPSSASGTIADVATVSVGTVVDFRDPHRGAFAPYLTTRELPQTGEFTPTRTRQVERRLFKPPFVVVRRTSRPTVEEPRLRPVIVRGTVPVAVENHLLVLQPSQPTLRACRDLVTLLGSTPTTIWLNKRIRLRHLTVSALRDVPVEGMAIGGKGKSAA